MSSDRLFKRCLDCNKWVVFNLIDKQTICCSNCGKEESALGNIFFYFKEGNEQPKIGK